MPGYVSEDDILVKWSQGFVRDKTDSLAAYAVKKIMAVLSDEIENIVRRQDASGFVSKTGAVAEEYIEKALTAGLEEGTRNGMLDALCGLVNDGVISFNDAAARAGMSPAEFDMKAGRRLK